MRAQRQTAGPGCASVATVDRASRGWLCILHRYINIACLADMQIKSAKAQFMGGHHA